MPRKKGSQIIVADVGGTNARFALAEVQSHQLEQISLSHEETYASGNYPSLGDVLATYREQHQIDTGLVCMAVAGPVSDGKAKFTNLDWQVNASRIEEKFSLEHVSIINDFAAFAQATPYLPQQDMSRLIDAPGAAGAPIAAIGAGTGFGVAALAHTNKGYQVSAAEGGHTILAAADEFQWQILQAAKEEFDYICVERLLSGTGLALLYRCVAKVNGQQVQHYQSADVSRLAVSGQDSTCEQTLNLFCQWLGAVAGDIALIQGARGGVVIGGGVLPRFIDFVKASPFEQAFKAKGLMTEYMGDIPVDISLNTNAALVGSAIFLANELADSGMRQ
ncbi:glucokinase [Shewanella sp. UCD-KL12]|uniref:glucokinase n=1 Tax=Shewanella sp. UCD-KL12 TaxID=1917163 RepID=UPI000971213F|nr:glucokinase [Shewanella sp. UCD-KL12]